MRGKLTNLLLECKNMGDTAINWILKSGLSFIWDCDCSFTTVTHRKVSKKLWDIACTKDLMNGCKMGSTLLMAKIRCKNTTSHTFSSQEFAGSTRRSWTSHLGLFNWNLRIPIWNCFWLYQLSLQLCADDHDHLPPSLYTPEEEEGIY